MLASSPHAALERSRARADASSRGAIFTRRAVVEFMLELVGYTSEHPLHERRLLEPSFGGGDFLIPCIERLLRAWKMQRPSGDAVEELRYAIRGVELHLETFKQTQATLLQLLLREGLSQKSAEYLLNAWLLPGDFLQLPLEGSFDFVVGNPPYIRPELIPASLLAAYRKRYQTMYARADIYIPFMERSLSLLSEQGQLAFICADRWMKNRYGGPLRHLISTQYQLNVYVDMVDTPAFHSEVAAYPAIVVVGRHKTGRTRIARRPTLDAHTLTRLAATLRSSEPLHKDGRVDELSSHFNGSEPWLLEKSEALKLIRRLEEHFPSLEAAGCHVGIGVATGADRVFMGPWDALEVEPERKLRLVTTRDIVSGTVEWQGLGLINPFEDSGKLVNLRDYPLLERYLERHRSLLSQRHCARSTPNSWYRTIDGIRSTLTTQPKLLIPDIKGKAHIVFEPGGLYPHHNLYYVTAEQWDLRALQAVLLSSLTQLFIAAYSSQLRGGFMRFQAQHLRRLRLPAWSCVSERLRQALRIAALQRDLKACDQAVSALFELSADEQTLLKSLQT